MESKENCRKKCLKMLKLSALKGKLLKDKRVEKVLLTLLKSLKSKNILIYYPLPFECNVLPLIKKTRRRYRFYLPFMQDVSFKMVPFRLPIKNYKFDIKQSGNSFFKNFKIDTAVVPIIGIDDTFRRVGFGKGMYDRFFDSLDYRCNIIFVQSKFCKCDDIVTTKQDIAGNFLITPKALFSKRKKGFKNDGRDAYRRCCDSSSSILYNKKN